MCVSVPSFFFCHVPCSFFCACCMTEHCLVFWHPLASNHTQACSQHCFPVGTAALLRSLLTFLLQLLLLMLCVCDVEHNAVVIGCNKSKHAQQSPMVHPCLLLLLLMICCICALPLPSCSTTREPSSLNARKHRCLSIRLVFSCNGSCCETATTTALIIAVSLFFASLAFCWFHVHHLNRFTRAGAGLSCRLHWFNCPS